MKVQSGVLEHDAARRQVQHYQDANVPLAIDTWKMPLSARSGRNGHQRMVGRLIDGTAKPPIGAVVAPPVADNRTVASCGE